MHEHFVLSNVLALIIVAVLAIFAIHESDKRAIVLRWLENHRDDCGQAIIEMTLLAPIMIVLGLGSLDLSRAFSAKADLNGIANRTLITCASQAAQSPPVACDATTTVTNAASALHLDTSQLSVSWDGTNLALSYTYTPVGIVGGPVVLTAGGAI
jgi:hypothetical protein